MSNQTQQYGTTASQQAASHAGYQNQPARNLQPEMPSTVTRAVSESESLARDIKEGVVSGFVGSGTVLTGEANFKGMLRIDGQFTGHINSDKGTLIVSSGGQVDANIEVAAAKINGTVNGDIIATQRIEMGRTAHVNGNIQTPVLVIEQGAVFEGGCRMIQQKAVHDKQMREEQVHVSDMPLAAVEVSTTSDVAS